MLKTFSLLVFLWGLLITSLPWLITSDRNTATNMIVSSLGLVIIGSALAMWCKAGSETR